MKYATDTSVSVVKSRGEIEDMVTRAGASLFGSMAEAGRATIVFTLKDKRVMFELELPDLSEFATRRKVVFGRPSAPAPVAPAEQHRAWEQACRSRWRALALTIKAKLVSVESGIEMFEEAFLAHIVVPGAGGRSAQRFGEVAVKAIHAAYTGGKLPPLLGSGS